MVRIAAATSPTPAACLNRVARFSRDITTERLRRGVFTGVAERDAAIDDCATRHDTRPQPFSRIQGARELHRKVIRADTRSSGKQHDTRG